MTGKATQAARSKVSSENGSTKPNYCTKLGDLKPAARRYVTTQFGETVYRLQNLNAKEYTEYQEIIQPENEDDPPALAKGKFFLVAKCLVDGDGRRIVADESVSALFGLDPALLDHLFTVASDHAYQRNTEALVKN